MPADDGVIKKFELRSPLPAGWGTMPPDEWVLDSGRSSEHSRRISNLLPPALADAFRLLRFNIVSALIIRGAFVPSDNGQTPASFVDRSCDPLWWPAANTTASLAASQEIQLCSYSCENEGHLFVHLTPSHGDAKSQSKLSGHTDGSVLPFPDESCAYADIAPSPDLVVLCCIRNPRNVDTRVAPLSRIYGKLSDRTIKVLKEPIFDFVPQSSFNMDASFVNCSKPVLVHDQSDGLLIRFSHSNVTTASQHGKAALVELKAAIASSFEGIALAPGDVLFVNNRTALHGRSEVGAISNEPARWLLRTYGMYSRRATYALEARKPFMLLPKANGPYELRR